MGSKAYGDNKNEYTFIDKDGNKINYSIPDGSGGVGGIHTVGQKKHAATIINHFLTTGRRPASYDEYIDILKRNGFTDGDNASAFKRVMNNLDMFLANQKIDEVEYSKAFPKNEDVNKTNEQYTTGSNYYDLITDPNSLKANEYKQDMYNTINTKQSEMDSLYSKLELDAYKTLGQKQIELERNISNQRLSALKSGTTSAQLAAMELQNLFASQDAALNINQQYNQSRFATQQESINQRSLVTPDLYNLINQNKTTLANLDTQRYAAYTAARSYSPAAQSEELSRLKTINPDAYYIYTKQNNS
jgi:hypothetical protein